MVMSAANILTLLRLILAPVVVFLFFSEKYGAAFVLFCIAGATDLIDGTVARLLKQSSESGALLDPIADKVLLQSVFWSLWFKGTLPLWFTGMAFLRDAMIVGGILYLVVVRAPMPCRAAFTSKIATLLQIVVAVLGLGFLWKPGFMLQGVSLEQWLEWSVLAASLFIAASGIHYIALGCSLLGRRAT
jgi:cardiolipin synthase